jgi:hypothetical protein
MHAGKLYTHVSNPNVQRHDYKVVFIRRME